MTSFIERKINDICGRWLEGFNRDNVEISLLQAKITLSDLHFKTDELCVLSPAISPSFLYVGKLVVEVPLAFNLSRPLKIVVSDVQAVLRLGEYRFMEPKDVRKSVSASVHLKALLDKMVADFGRSEPDEEQIPATISLQTVASIRRVIQSMEVSLQDAHVRLEESRVKRQGEAQASCGEAVVLGICLRNFWLGPDRRAHEDMGHANSEPWIGHKFRKMETGLLGKFYVSAQTAPDDRDTAPSDDAPPPRTFTIAKFACARGLSAYFCHDRECFSRGEDEKTLRWMREGLKHPPNVLPALLGRCRAGLGIVVQLSAAEWGKIESIELRLLIGDVVVNVSDDHLGYLLRWTSLLQDATRTLALSAVRPERSSFVAQFGSGSDSKSRYYRALWRHAAEFVMRDLRSLVLHRDQHGGRPPFGPRDSGAEQCASANLTLEAQKRSRSRGRLWRLWFGEWVKAARYVSLRELIHPRLVVERFCDEGGRIHERLHEDLDLEEHQEQRQVVGAAPAVTKLETERPRRLAKYLMPWELPQANVEEGWKAISRQCSRWERRHTGGVGLAMAEEKADLAQLDPTIFQALWSMQLKMDAELPSRISAAARRMAASRFELRRTLDGLWRVRAEKQRRLGLDVVSGASMEMSTNLGEAVHESTDGDGADRVGTLLLRLGKLEGVGGIGPLSLAPKVKAILMLEESSASVEDMDKETQFTKVAKYDALYDCCFWDEIFNLQVELDASYVQERRRERARKNSRATSKTQGVASNPKASSPSSSTSSPSHGKTSSSHGQSLKCQAAHSDDWSDRTESSDSLPSKSSGPRCSFLLAVSCVEKSIFGQQHMGGATMPGSQLTATPLKVVKHRCALFSATNVVRQQREIVLQSVFVPPGEDVTVGEELLNAVGKGDCHGAQVEQPRRRTQDNSARNGASPDVEALGPTCEPWREPADEMPQLPIGRGELDHTVADTSSTGIAIGLVTETPDTQAPRIAPELAERQLKPSVRSGSIPVVDTTLPGRLAVSFRVAALRIITSLNASAASRRAGAAKIATPRMDELAVLVEASARGIEACGEVDVARGKAGARAEATTIELVDNSLLRQSDATGDSTRSAAAGSSQVTKIGPVLIEASSHCAGADRPAMVTATSQERLRVERGDDPGHCPKAMEECGRSNGRTGAGKYRKSNLASSDICSFLAKGTVAGKVSLGSYTFAFGGWHDRPLREKMRKHVRFVVPHRLLEMGTSLIGAATPPSRGLDQSPSWLLRAAREGLTLDVQMPRVSTEECGKSDKAKPPTSNTYIYVSSSESEADAPTRNLTREYVRPTRRGGQPQAHETGTTFFSPGGSTVCAGAAESVEKWTKEVGGVRSHVGGFSQDASGDGRLDDDSTVDRGFSDRTHANLVARVRELEEELAALKAASSSRLLLPSVSTEEET